MTGCSSRPLPEPPRAPPLRPCVHSGLSFQGQRFDTRGVHTPPPGRVGRGAHLCPPNPDTCLQSRLRRRKGLAACGVRASRVLLEGPQLERRLSGPQPGMRTDRNQGRGQGHGPPGQPHTAGIRIPRRGDRDGPQRLRFRGRGPAPLRVLGADAVNRPPGGLLAPGRTRGGGAVGPQPRPPCWP